MTRKPDEWMPLHIGAYHADTTHLTRDQHGAYVLLLMAYWRRGGPLPADDGRLAAIVKASPAEWRKLRPVMAEFFSEQDGAWRQGRADRELEKAKRMTEAKAEAGRKGAANRWHGDDRGNGTAMAEPPPSHKQTDAPLPSPSPVTNHHHQLDDADDGFDEFFQAFPKQENRKDAQEQYRLALAKAPREAILAGAKRYFKTCSDRQPRHISPPAVWLAKERWTDGAAAPDPLAIEPDPSWGGLADRFKAEIGASNFQAYFADARVVDGDPQRIQVKSAVKKRLIDQKFPRQLRKLCGEVVIEVAA